MNKWEVLQLGQMLGLKNSRDRGDWIQFSCPFAKLFHEKGTDDNPSFGISVGTRSSFHCFACQVKGNVKILPTLMEILLKKDYSEARYFVFNHNSIDDDFDELDLNFFNKQIEPIDKKALQTFAKLPKSLIERFKLTKTIVDKYKLLFDKTSMRLVFTIFDQKGNIVGFRGRMIIDNPLRAKYYSYTHLHQKKQDPKTYGIWYLMNEPLLKDSKLFLVEGERDAIALKMYDEKINVWASMGASISVRQLHNLNKVLNDVVLFFDNDAAGKKARNQAIKALRNAKSISIIGNYANCKDPAEIYEKGLMKTVLDSIKPIRGLNDGK